MLYDVVIVGAGFSAIGLLVNLLCELPEEAAIAVVADDSGFGRGIAYRTELHLHRLNVPAGRMSAFPDRPNDFVDWLTKRGRNATPACFVSRHDYGLYMRDTLANLLRPQRQRARVDFVKLRAKSMTVDICGIKEMRLSNGEALSGRNVVLCLGLGTASLPRLTFSVSQGETRGQSRIVDNPWRLGWLSGVGNDDRICILGSGLTMVDQVLAMREHGHRGPIEILSRRGLLPHAHARSSITPVHVEINGEGMELSEMLRTIRRVSADASDWRAVMDGLRHHTQELWQQLTAQKRARFLRHALAWWNIHRHRLSPQVAEQFGGFIADGSVSVREGYLCDIHSIEQGINVAYRQRGAKLVKTINADWLVNCTGMERAGITHSPLLKSMYANNLVDLDPHGLRLGCE